MDGNRRPRNESARRPDSRHNPHGHHRTRRSRKSHWGSLTLILVLLLAAATLIGVYLADHKKEDEGNPIRSEKEMEQSSDKPLEDDPDNTQPQDQDEQNTDADTSESLEENNPDNTQEEDDASSDGNSSEESYQQLGEDFAKEKEEYYLLLANQTIRCQKIDSGNRRSAGWICDGFQSSRGSQRDDSGGGRRWG